MAFGMQVMLGVAASPQHDFSITAGQAGESIGYVQGAIGSIVSGTLPDGRTIRVLLDDASANTSELSIGGFASDPGQAYIVSVMSNSVTRMSASASYSYGSGIATWTWAGVFGFSSGNSYPSVLRKF